MSDKIFFFVNFKTLIFRILLTLLINCLLPAQSHFMNSGKHLYEFQKDYREDDHHSAETLLLLNKYDVKFYKLDLSVSKYSVEIAGSGTIYAKIQNAPLDTLLIELIDSLAQSTYMVVDSVKVNGQICSFIHNENLITINLSPPLPADSYFTAEIYYYGSGEACEASGYSGIFSDVIFNSRVTNTSSEPFGAKVWYPCKQVLNDKADSLQIIITTEKECKAGSNGILKSVVQLPGNKVRYEWKSNYPTDYYLVSFSVGDYIEDITYAPVAGTNDSVLIQSYLFQNSPYLQMNLRAIEMTKDYIQLYSGLFGDYPFKNEKYGYCLDPSAYGAMENQTMTTIGYLALDTTASFVFTLYYYWYSAHETAHSWFGDNVTCAGWQDIWVNEGFASYSEYLALQNLESQARANYWMSYAHTLIKRVPDGSVYVPYESRNDVGRIFDYRLTYCKGAAILHMIRFEVNNDSLFFLSLKNYQNEYKGSTATGLNFKQVLEETTGRDFTGFFNQWYFGEGFPKYTVYWEQANDTLKIRSVQTTSSAVTPLFKMPMEYALLFEGVDTTIRIYQNSNDQVTEIYFPHTVTSIVTDPHNWVIDASISIPTGINDVEPVLYSFNLYQNYPNPFNPDTKIMYSLPENSKMQLTIYNILGNKIAALVNEEKSAGKYEVNWNAAGLPSGVYFYRLQAQPIGRQAGSFVQTRKMILLK